jgi:hypothetical protein
MDQIKKITITEKKNCKKNKTCSLIFNPLNTERRHHIKKII